MEVDALKLISHRGNLNGSNPELENHPHSIEKCLKMGYDVEIDVWCIDKKVLLGHDEPQHEVDIEFLKRPGLWCHAKNRHALQTMIAEPDIHCFWHQEDDYTITSRGIIWCFPGKILPVNSVCVMPERSNYSYTDMMQCQGICSDYIVSYDNMMKEA